PSAESVTANPRGSVGPARPPGEKPIASPALRRRARDAGVDLRQVRGTGPAGRIGHDDLDAFLRGGPKPGASAARTANTSIETVKIIGLRRRIAQKMAESKRRVAHFSYVEEVDVTQLEELRATLNAESRQDRPRLTLMPFLMQALVKAIADFPEMNALYDDEAETIERHGGVHIGIATQTPAGLMVPVVRHCETRGLWDCAAEVQRLAEAAREGRATRTELTGSTITITSLGALGGIVTTPVINRPEVAIIGVNKQVVRPVWQGAQFVPRTMMNLSSSFDHRVIDGYVAARFVQRIKGLLEAPATIFMEA
ncbi:MAG TPA: dihydrolipoamide acetyltransferase family protein, partial [Inquilinus sp.]|nr:dihydrolipoamide acetyltransferase family protein [Inquilinus sp.]